MFDQVYIRAQERLLYSDLLKLVLSSGFISMKNSSNKANLLDLCPLKNYDHARLIVKDLQKSKSWYQMILGVDPHINIDKYAEFKYGSCIIVLAQADEKSPFSFGGQVIYWRVENINTAITYFCAAGASIYRGPLQIEGDDLVCQIQDPFGNVLGLIGKGVHI